MDAENESHHDQVKLLAFHLWQERGAPLGEPDTDWFQAEQTLKAQTDQGQEPEHQPPALSTLAKTIGSALGSVTALLNPDA